MYQTKQRKCVDAMQFADGAKFEIDGVNIEVPKNGWLVHDVTWFALTDEKFRETYEEMESCAIDWPVIPSPSTPMWPVAPWRQPGPIWIVDPNTQPWYGSSTATPETQDHIIVTAGMVQ